MRIVIVDDEPKTRKGLSKLLAKNDIFQIVGIFANPIEALEFMAKDPPDVLLTDIRMPQLSGLELIEKIREVLPDLNIIIISGYRDFNYAQKAISMGVYRYLTKPTDPDQLINALYSLVVDSLPPVKMSVSNLTIQSVVEDINNNYSQQISLTSLADKYNVSPQHLSKLFKTHTGVNFSKYISKIRLERAKILLKDPRKNVSEVATLVGFGDSRYFSSLFKREFGLTPIEYRNSLSN